MPPLQTALRSLAGNRTRATPLKVYTVAQRTFAATALVMGKQEWMFILPDKPNSLDARMKIRPQHLENLKPKISSGLVTFGGASLDEPLKEGAGPQINGSVMIVESDSQEEAEKIIKEDIYYTSGVWDAEKIQVFPFKSAVREPLS